MAQDAQEEVIKSMTPEQKLKAAMQLYYSAWELKAAHLRAMYPKMDEKGIHRQVRDYFLYAST